MEDRYDTVLPEPSPLPLVIPDALAKAMASQAEAGYPHEVCGLLLGQADGSSVRVERLFDAKNLNEERAHDRYILDPEAFLAADREGREAGLEIVGIWHSHPDSPARPSITDLEAAWAGYSYVIVSVRQGALADLRSYRLDGERFREETVHP